MLISTILLAMLAATPGQTLDAFSYADAAAANDAWHPAEGTLPVEVAADGPRSVLQLRGDFAQRPAKRAVIDRGVKLDLASPGLFTLEVRGGPQAAGQLTLYFRSGHGWYAAGATLAAKDDWQTLRFPKSAFRTEDQPVGWQQIDGIRIALWRSGESDVAIRLGCLAAVTRDVAVLVPQSDKHQGESRAAMETAEHVGQMLSEIGLEHDVVSVESLPAGTLGRRAVAIVPYCPHMDDAAVSALEQFVAAGGKLLVCYQLPARLGAALGFRSVKYVKPERPGMLAEMRFDASDVPGLPAAVRQASWNITVAEPAGEEARVIGTWYDDQGQPTGYAAMLLSRRGAFLSHILLGDDPARKRQLLAAVLGFLHPPLWPQMVQAALERSSRTGHLEDRQALEQFVREQGRPAALEKLSAAQAARDQVEKLSQAGQFPQACVVAEQLGELLREAYLRSQPSRPTEGRAMWNHSGTGAYPGDWERTAKLMADNGLNMILPNMLWGGVAHYASDVLPRSKTFEQYGDQIAQCVEAAHRHGLQVHVWKVDWNLGHECPPEFIEKLRHEKRLMASATGEEVLWLCPSNPENQKLELESLLEVARKYPVDGLHFDYIRYLGGNVCYCDGCRGRFEQESGRKVAEWPAECYSGDRKDEYGQWRCDQITKLVAAVHREAKRLRPEIKLSAAVFGSYPDCKKSVAQDWVQWVQSGYLDFLCPMDYSGSNEQFCRLVENQLRLVEGKIPVYPGIGATASRVTLTSDRVAGQVFHARRLGAAGFTIFNLSQMTAEGIVPALHLGVSAEKATPAH